MSRMNALIRSNVYYLTIDWDIENLVKSCRGCALEAKAQLVKYQSWPEMVQGTYRLWLSESGTIGSVNQALST